MTWWDDRARIRAENEAWREEFLPRLRERESQKAAQRDRARAVLETIEDDEDRAFVINYFGV